MLAIVFVLLEQATSTTINTTAATDTTTTTFVTATGSIDNNPVTMPRNTTSSSNSSKVSQERNSAEHISPDPLTKDVPSTVIHKPKPQLGKLRPVINTENEEISCSVSPEGTSSAAGNTDKVNTCRDFSEENLPISHIPPAMEQFAMHSEESTDVAGNFQSNVQ